MAGVPERVDEVLISWSGQRVADPPASKWIFLSHAHADRALADLLRDTLVLGGVAEPRIFYSSDRATGIPSGKNVLEYLRESLRGAGLVIELVSETFLTRPMCLMELGGAWTLGAPTCPIVVPPLTRDVALAQIGQVQAGFLGTADDVDELFDELHTRLANDVGIFAQVAPWKRAIRSFKQRLESVLPDAPRPAPETVQTPGGPGVTVESTKQITFSNVSRAPSGSEIYGRATNEDSAWRSVIIEATCWLGGTVCGVKTAATLELEPGATKTFMIRDLPRHDRCSVGVKMIV